MTSLKCEDGLNDEFKEEKKKSLFETVVHDDLKNKTSYRNNTHTTTAAEKN